MAPLLAMANTIRVQCVSSFNIASVKTAELFNHVVSVERVLEFGKLEPEAALYCDADGELLEKGWPMAGKN